MYVIRMRVLIFWNNWYY